MKKLLFVYNPMAGRGALEEKIEAVTEIFADNGYETDVHATTEKGDGYRYVSAYLAAAKKSGRSELLPERIVCAGGDGTLQEVMRAVTKSGTEIPIGIIPTGSTNDFGYSLRLPEGIEKQAECAAQGRVFKCDGLRFFDRDIVYTAAFGLFSEVSYATPQNLKNRLGHAGYILYGAKTIFKTKKIHAKVNWDGGAIEDDFLLGMAVNAKSVGGFRRITGPDVKLNDGKTEMLLVKWPKNPLQLVKIIYEALSHRTDGKYFSILRTGHIDFEFDRNVSWSFDGEYGGKGIKAEINVNERGVSYIVPFSQKQKRNL